MAGKDIDPKSKDLKINTVSDDDSFLTTNQGLRIQDDQNSLKAGPRGPTLLEDFQLREKITHFDHERIPERIVHARGSAAHGYFEPFANAKKYSKAAFLQNPASRTPVFVRFSTVAGFRGSPDLARDVRGFAVKFYTEEGVFDLVGNNIPVFFIQDGQKFPDLVHSVKPEPHHEIPQASSAHDTFWDFISLMPESMHMIMWAMSDRAIPRSYRMMEGFGVHTFRLIDKDGNSNFVKFHWKPALGMQSVLWDEAVKVNGNDPDFHRRDLWEAIDQGDFPEWELGFQIFSEKDAESFYFDPLDPTKLVPEEDFPVIRVGKLVLNRNPDNFFAETEQVAFHPGHIVPGIDFSNDPLLAGRLFSYTDTQLSRLGGPNFHEIPINRSLAPVHNNQRDGHMRQTINPGRVSYQPNRLGGGCPFQAKASEGGFVSFPEAMTEAKVRDRGPKFFDHFTQARLFYISQTAVEQAHIQNALKFELSKVETSSIHERMLGLLLRVDEDLARKVGSGLGLNPEPLDDEDLNYGKPAGVSGKAYQSLPTRWDVKASPALSILKQGKKTIATEKVAVLIAKGFSGETVKTLRKALAQEGASLKLIGPRMGEIEDDQGQLVKVDFTFNNSSSVLFDAVFVPGGGNLLSKLANEGNALRFVAESFRHCKALGVHSDTQQLLRSTGIASTVAHAFSEGHYEKDGLVVDSIDLVTRFIKAMKAGRAYARENLPQLPV